MAESSLAHVVAEVLMDLGLPASASGTTVTLPAHGQSFEVVSKVRDGGPTSFVVRSHIGRMDRELLADRAVGWFDLSDNRISLRLPGIWLGTQVDQPAGRTQNVTVDPLGGAVVSGVSLAALLAWPEPMPGVRDLARRLQATPGGVSLAARRLIDAGLLTRDRRAVAPLFWSVCDRWTPAWTHIPRSLLPKGEVLDVSASAAAKLGAPIVAGAGGPTEYLVRDSVQVRVLTMRSTRLGRDVRPSALASVTVAPSPIAFDPSFAPRGRAPEVLLALTIATDAGRGAEIVRSWEGDHVWH